MESFVYLYYGYITVNITILNVKTLNTVNLLLELTGSAANMHIMCIQEYRYYHSEQEIKLQILELDEHLSKYESQSLSLKITK